jgi:hypothetical protein
MVVLYGALDAQIWYSDTSRVPAVVEIGGRRQAPREETHFRASAEYWQSEQASSNKEGAPPSPGGSPNNNNLSNCTVVVIANVWFKAGEISTRSYNIRASCSQVNFHNATTVDCKPG